MTLLTAQKLFAYLALVTALGALAAVGVIGPVGGVILPLTVLTSWFWEPEPAAVERQRSVWNLILIGFIALTGYKVFSGTVPVLEPAVDLVLVLIVAKLFQRATAKDYVQIYALTFLMMAVASVLHEGILFGLVFGTYLVFAAAGFCVTRIVAETEGSRVMPSSIRVGRRELALLGAMGGALVVSSAMFFVILPRVGVGMGKPTPEQTSTTQASTSTGFSSTVDLGGHGAVGLDHTVVMKVEVDGPLALPYWRGMAFDFFDGRRWHVSPGMRRRHPAPVDSVEPLSFQVNEIWTASDDVEVEEIEQTIQLEPLDADVVFALPRATSVRFPAFHPEGHDPIELEIDASGGIYHKLGGHHGLHYEVVSTVVPRPRYDPSQDTPVVVEAYYLDSRYRGTRVEELAHRITEPHGDPLAKARALQAHLSTGYDYTLNLPRREGDPVEDFLFVNQRGHCEFFSTAMVVMLRTVGIAARNVNGFQGGDWDKASGRYIVRRLHAHSWVEAWIPGAGWVTFDPTPAGGLPDARPPDEGEDEASVLTRYAEYFQSLWREWVVDYDIRKQIDLLAGIDALDDSTGSATLSSMARDWWRWAVLIGWFLLLGFVLRRLTHRWASRFAALFGVVLAVSLARVLWPDGYILPRLLAILVPLWLLWGSRMRVLFGRRHRVGIDPLARPYLRLVRRLERSEVVPGAGALGPEALARALDGDDRFAPIAAVIRRYAALRFGPRNVGREDIAKLKSATRQALRGASL